MIFFNISNSSGQIKYVIVPFLFFLVSGVFFGCFNSDDASDVNEQVYATVNGVPLTESTVRANIPQEFYDKLTSEHKRKIVEELVNNELLYQGALAADIDKEAEIKRLLLNSKQYLLRNEYLEREFSDIKQPNTDELKEYYARNKEFFSISSTEFLVRYALFDNKEDAQNFYTRVKKNESFSDLSENLSKHPSSNSGGSLGIVNEDSVEPNIWETINNVYSKVGLRKISDPFGVVDGWGCVIVDEVYEPGTFKPFEYVRDLLIDMYMSEKREEAKEALIARLTAEADIKYEILR
ncbi:peptidyl-prolyl cis-trans isomerase [Candidatus Latescibacterota bacterium]